MVSDQIYGLLGNIQDCLFLYTRTCGTTNNNGPLEEMCFILES